MEIERTILKEILEAVKHGLASKEESLVGSTSFYFEEGKVHTFNDSVSVSCPIPEIDFQGEVNSVELLGFVSKTGAKMIKLELEQDNKVLVLTSGKAKAGLAVKEESTLPIDSIGKISKWKKLDPEVLAGMSFVKHACGTDFTRPIITCVNVTNGLIEGTDGFRIASTDLEIELPVDDFLLPASVVPYVVSIKPTHISLGEAWVHFKTANNVVLSCRIFEDAFPDSSAFRKYEGTDVVFPDTILDILSRASIFNASASGNVAYVIVEVSLNKMIVSSKSDTGWFTEKAKIAYKGEAISFVVTISLLQEILKETKTAKFKDTLLMFSFGNNRYVTMLRGDS